MLKKVILLDFEALHDFMQAGALTINPETTGMTEDPLSMPNKFDVLIAKLPLRIEDEKSLPPAKLAALENALEHLRSINNKLDYDHLFSVDHALELSAKIQKVMEYEENSIQQIYEFLLFVRSNKYIWFSLDDTSREKVLYAINKDYKYETISGRDDVEERFLKLVGKIYEPYQGKTFNQLFLHYYINIYKLYSEQRRIKVGMDEATLGKKEMNRLKWLRENVDAEYDYCGNLCPENLDKLKKIYMGYTKRKKKMEFMYNFLHHMKYDPSINTDAGIDAMLENNMQNNFDYTEKDKTFELGVARDFRIDNTLDILKRALISSDDYDMGSHSLPELLIFLARRCAFRRYHWLVEGNIVYKAMNMILDKIDEIGRFNLPGTAWERAKLTKLKKWFEEYNYLSPKQRAWIGNMIKKIEQSIAKYEYVEQPEPDPDPALTETELN
ncbi:hypothetical protein ACFL5G_02780 [Candidatus Margulisiibacteriota bacterium]